MAKIADRVKQGAGLIMIGGYHSLGPGGYGNSELQKILPVALGARDIGQATETFQPTLTPDGRNHPIFANIARFFNSPGSAAQTTALPPLDGWRQSDRRETRSHDSVGSSGRESGQRTDARNGRTTVWHGAHGGIYGRYNTKLASGDEDHGERNAFSPFLGPDDPLVGTPHRGS